MRRLKILYLMALLLIVLSAVPLTFSQSTIAASAATGPIYWGAYIDGSTYGLSDAPWNTQTIDTFESHAQKKVSILHWGQPWWNCNASKTTCGYQYFDNQKAQYDKIRTRGIIPLVDWSSLDLSAPAPEYEQPNYALRTIIAGNHDAYIRTWAQQAKAWGHPFFLRFDWEMNGTWYPWSEKRNGNQPGEYAQAWRHVRDIFKQVGANNVTWVWCVNNLYTGSIPIEGLYPGDAYVDWTCVDGYNRGTNPLKNDSWKSFYTVFSQTYTALLTVAPAKPIMIGETASTEYGGSKATWIRNAFTNYLPNSFPKIKAVVWFNWNDGGMDWVIESSATAQQAFAESINSSYYAQSEFANLSTSPIPPRDQLNSSPTSTPLPATATPTYTPPTPLPLPVSATPTTGPGTVVTFQAIADAYVVSAYPSTNYGANTILRVESSPIVYSYLRFKVSGLNGATIRSAMLRVYANDSNTTGFAVHPVADTTWTESGVTYNNAPARGAVINTSQSIVAGTWMDVDVSSYVKAEGTINLAMSSASTTNTRFAARETAGKEPQLVISLSNQPTPTATRPLATSTPILPTATATRPPATSTPVLPTATATRPPATSTPILPTATATRPPATSTPLLPTATPTPTAVSSVHIKVNFQTSTSTTPAGFLPDTGLVFAGRGNGFSYGWNADNTANARQRNATNSPNPQSDTLIHMQRNGSFTWEIALPNGNYQVSITAGDPSYYDSIYKIRAEGSLLVNGTPTSANRWFSGAGVVSVSDGRLTITNDAAASNNKIDFIQIDTSSATAPAVAPLAPQSEMLPALPTATEPWLPAETPTLPAAEDPLVKPELLLPASEVPAEIPLATPTAVPLTPTLPVPSL